MKTIKELINEIEATKIDASYTTNSGKTKELTTLDQVSSRLQGLLVTAKITKIIDSALCSELMPIAKQGNAKRLYIALSKCAIKTNKAVKKVNKKAIKKADKKSVNDELIRQLIEQNQQLINLLSNR